MSLKKDNIKKLVILERGLEVDEVGYIDGQEIYAEDSPERVETFLDQVPEKRFVFEGEEQTDDHYVLAVLKYKEKEEDKPTEDEIDDMLKDELVELAEDIEEVDDEELDLKDDYLDALKTYFGYKEE